MLPFQSGVFRGTGRWIDQRAESGYAVEYAVGEGPEGSVIHTVTRLFPVPEGTTVYGQKAGVYEERSTVTFVPGERNAFRIRIEGARGVVQGLGYCFGDQCHYEAEAAEGVHLEFTFTVGEGRIGGLGSSTNRGNFTSWQETLRRTG